MSLKEILMIVALILMAAVTLGILTHSIRVEFSCGREDDEPEGVSPDDEYLAKFWAKFEQTRKYLIQFAEHARQEGIISLEYFLYGNNKGEGKIDESFDILRDVVKLCVDGTDTEMIDQWCKNAAMFADSDLEEIYIELIRQGANYLMGSFNPKFAAVMLNAFDINRKIL